MAASGSRRDTPIVAWHEVPGKPALERNRPVGYGMIGLTEAQGCFSSRCAPCFLKMLDTLLERLVSGDVRAGAFPEPARWKELNRRGETAQ